MDGSTHLLSFLKASIANKRRIFISSLVILVLVLLYSISLPLEYRANILLQIKHKPLSTLATLNGNNNSPEEDSFNSQIALIRSAYILKPVIRNLGLDIEIKPDKNFSFRVPFLSKKRESEQSIKISTLDLPTRYVRKTLYLKLISPDHYQLLNTKKTLLVEGKVGELVETTSGFKIKVDYLKEPSTKQFIVKKYSESEIYNRLLSKLMITELTNAGSFVKDVGLLQLTLKGTNEQNVISILNEIALVAQKKDKELKAFAAGTTLTFLNQQLPIIHDSLIQAEAKLNSYRTSHGKIDLKLQTEYLLNHLSNLDKQIEEIRLKKTSLSENITIYHPFLISLNKRFHELSKQRDEIFNKIRQLPSEDQLALNLTRDVNVKSKLYMLLLNQIHTQEVIKAGIVSDINILSFATNADVPLPKNFVVIGIFSVLIGILLGCLINLVNKIINRRIDDPKWIQENLHIPTLITIPHLKKYSVLNKIHGASAIHKSALPALDVANETESLRILRTILHKKLSSNSNNIICCFSICRNVGKSFITSNLAVLFAKMNKKTLLIDADLRNGKLTHYFPEAGREGLMDIMDSQAETNPIMESSAQPNLFLLSPGKIINNSADVLITGEFQKFLQETAKNYDYIIINAGLLSITDTLLIAAHTGINLLIVGANMHKGSDLKEAVTNSQLAGITIDASIYNEVNPKQNRRKSFSFSRKMTIFNQIKFVKSS